ncbi:MAG: magnesium transporter [Sphingobacteriales bacterium]|jgi:magnesium transporter|nr:MAG: magnesium transporter [Sphingobacteriales bacterium]
MFQEANILLNNKNWFKLRTELVATHPSQIAEFIETLEPEQQVIVFRILPVKIAARTFEHIELETQQSLLKSLGQVKMADILNNMSPDDRTQLLEELPSHILKKTLNLLSDEERKVASSLLGYPENSVGRMMTPYYVAIKLDWTVERVLEHIRRYGKRSETVNMLYVVDDKGKLIDDIRIGHVLFADPQTLIADLIDQRFVYVTVTDDIESVITLFKQYDRQALPVLTHDKTLVGIITFDDVMDVEEEENTEDMQKFGGMDSLELPYIETPLLEMVKKRAGWLTLLFLGELLTASAMSHFEEDIAKAVVLALFVPLIISSGGNSGSQAATLIIRSLAIAEITLKDWWYVMRREFLSGLILGLILGVFGFLRVFIWNEATHIYGEHAIYIAITVGLTLVGIVMWGTLCGSMLPFALKKLGFDPATSSAPFVATLVDVTGLLLYFYIATLILHDKIL